ncbi:MAG: BON domain-containing protein [Planctomycetales bacterium]|nr:BON domain-containing protein [Planctomycetales bacterium]
MTIRNEAGISRVDEPHMTDDLVARIRARLRKDSHLRCLESRLTIEQSGGTIVVSGRLYSFFLKQVVQEVVRRTPGVLTVVNQTEVAPRPK